MWIATAPDYFAERAAVWTIARIGAIISLRETVVRQPFNSAGSFTMASKVSLSNLLFAISVGLVIGVVVGAVAVAVGMPAKMIGPATGGLVGALIPTIYQMRARSRARASADGDGSVEEHRTRGLP